MNEVVVLHDNITAPETSSQVVKLNRKFAQSVLIEVREVVATVTTVIQVEGRLSDTGDWYPVYVENVLTGALANTITATGLYRVFAGGLQAVRTDVTTLSGGTMDVNAHQVLG